MSAVSRLRIWLRLALLSAAGLALSAISPLQAAPARIEALRIENYPAVQLQFYVELDSSEDEITPPVFRVLESRRGQEYTVAEALTPERSEAEALHLALVIDATRSVSPSAFRRLRKFGEALLDSLGPQDRAALYVIDAHPRELRAFSRDHNSLRSALQSLQRTGRRTRIYDALYLAMRACARQDAPAGQVRSAVVVLTDAREEDSLLSDRDSSDLNALRGPLDLAVYSYLFASKPAAPRGLERLALRTGGAVVASPVGSSAGSELRRMRRLSVVRYLARYQSPTAALFPGDSIAVRIVAPGGEESATQYSAPFAFWLRSVSPLAVALLIGLACLVIGLSLLALLLLIQRRNARNQASTSVVDAADREAKPGEVSASSSPQPSPMPGSPGPLPLAAAPAPHPLPDDELGAYLVSAEQRAESGMPMSDESIERAVHPQAREIAGALLDDDRKLYLREYAYRLTQSAWREAGEYKRARLEMQAQGGMAARDYDLFLEATVLGSGRWSHIPLRDASASPVHARIKRHDGRYIIYDLLSASGVLINGRKLLRPRGLVDGDELRLGRSRFVFRGEN
ncbi:MAG: VWA domain-containing protein [Leptospirales bacterium]|nr:VWA domain-containing protein [Leptospirales bacterium]